MLTSLHLSLEKLANPKKEGRIKFCASNKLNASDGFLTVVSAKFSRLFLHPASDELKKCC
jgi:hypothetical protein